MFRLISSGTSYIKTLIKNSLFSLTVSSYFLLKQLSKFFYQLTINHTCAYRDVKTKIYIVHLQRGSCIS